MNTGSQAPHNHVFLTQNGHELIDIYAIQHCKANGNYTDVFMDGIPNAYLICLTLKRVQQSFNSFLFFRVSRSHLVNFFYIKTFNRRTGKILLASGEEIVVARKKKSYFLKAWQAYAERIDAGL
ncbi:MAG TPA: LytTR family DNA-binding domain-containing protein [Bacteroidia bacterium]|nr:LytTR family DNA-binding domain-containing protein [Bacteroidia bacterium]HNU34871.1 LytTR family DNA-binding domain-containing protein [Bacteroidia bacterium]